MKSRGLAELVWLYAGLAWITAMITWMIVALRLQLSPATLVMTMPYYLGGAGIACCLVGAYMSLRSQGIDRKRSLAYVIIGIGFLGGLMAICLPL